MENDIRWLALAANDKRFDGAFFYGVRTTGIYCRPSCPSKLPKRDNVRFFDSAEAAESSGFRACRRCRPESGSPLPQVRKVIEAAARLDSDDPPSLETLAADSGLSPARFQKLFKGLVGVSPKKFSEAMRIERFKRSVNDGATVTDAMYDAGFGSSSRLYEKSADRLGMTPSAYAKRGKDMTITYAVADCELGKMLVARTAKGICSVTFGDDAAELAADLRKEFSGADIEPATDGLSGIVGAILAGLSGSIPSVDLPLDLRATAFQLRVWEELRKIPFGATVSYQEIAERIGSPSAVRAVARACASNRVALLVPCHRVVRSDGNVSGYRWGIERKRVILKNEKERAR